MRVRGLLVLGVLALLGGCSDEKDETPAAESGSKAIAVLTRVRGPEGDLHYLSALPELPADRALDRSKAVEFGDSQGAVWNGSVFMVDREKGNISRWRVGQDLSLSTDATLALAGIGITSPAVPLMAWSSATRAHIWDYATGQFVSWNPETMEIVSKVTVPKEKYARNGIQGDLEWPKLINGKVIYNIAWFDFDTLAGKSDTASVAWFDAASDAPEMNILEDKRCGYNTSVQPFADTEGYVYIVGDAFHGLLNVGTVTPVQPNACLVRIKPDFSGFDPDFYVDLVKATGSKAVQGGYAVGDGKHLIVNSLAATTPTPATADDYFVSAAWSFHVLDVKTGSVVPVSAIAPGGAANLTRLELDGVNMVQVYTAGADATRSATLHAVKVDGSATPVLDAGSAGDFEMIGRIR